MHTYRTLLIDRKAGRVKPGKTTPLNDQFALFHLQLGAYEETMKHVFEVVREAKVNIANGKKRLQELTESYTGLSDFELGRATFEREEYVEANIELANVLCGALFVILDRLIDDLAHKVPLPVPKSNSKKRLPSYYYVGRYIGRVRLPVLIEAASNNFRHADEWTDTKGRRDRARNIRVLRAAGVKGAALEYK